MSDLLKLDAISKRNGDIKAFPVPLNLKSTNMGKYGWGEITIAIDNTSVQNLWMQNSVGILYIINKDEWEKESK